MQAPVIFMVLVTAAVLVWPGRRRLHPAYELIDRASDGRAGDGRGTAGSVGVGSVGVGAVGLGAADPGSALGQLVGPPTLVERLRWLAHEDPIDVIRGALRRASSSRRSSADALDEALLAVLDALEPALIAGLTPARALELAAPTFGVGGVPGSRAEVRGPGVGRARVGHAGAPRDGVGALVEDAVRAAEAGSSIGRVWQRWADDSGSRTLGFVAAAWLLSERTGAPLAEAVSRAAARTRAELSRRRRVAAAVAGPRATVNVLSALPLVGPVFGLASGLDPAEVYLSSPLVLVAVGFGLALIAVGRWWCRRLVASVLELT